MKQQATIHLPTDPGSLDSAKATEPVALDLLGNLMEGLVRQGPGGILEPGVAARWESTDGRSFTFFLRKNARWSDGRTVTAEEFAFAWYRTLDPVTESNQAYRLYAIAGAEDWNSLDPKAADFGKRWAELRERVQIEVIDDYTLRVGLQTPNPQWPGQTAHPAFFPQRISQAGSGLGVPGEQLTSNGPFQLVKWSPGREVVLRKNPAYWDATSVRLEHVVFHIEPDAREALRLMDLGQLDMVYLPGIMAAELTGVERMSQPATMGLVLNQVRKPLTNLNLRRALYLAIDRERLLSQVAPGTAIPAASLIPPSLLGGWPPPQSVTPPAGDRILARHLWEVTLSELGMEGVTLRLLHAEETAPLAESLALMLQANLPGLTIERERVPFAERLERVRIGTFDMVLQGWVAETDDPLELLEQLTPDHPANDARWIHAAYRQAVERAKDDGVDRLPAAKEAEAILMGELPILPLYHPVRYWTVRPRLKGLRHFPLGARLDLRHAHIGL